MSDIAINVACEHRPKSQAEGKSAKSTEQSAGSLPVSLSSVPLPSLSAQSRFWPGAGASTVFILVLLTFVPVISQDFVRDDLDWLAMVRGPASPRLLGLFYGNAYRPFVIVYFYVLSHLSPSVFWFHLGSIGLHAANALLVYFVALKWRRSVPLAVLGALLFSIRAAPSQAVLWICSVGSLFCLLFGALCVLSFRQFLSRNSNRYFWFALGCYLLALLSREDGLFIPFLLAGCFLIYVSPQDWLMRLYLLLPFFLVDFAFLGHRFLARTGAVAETATTRFPRLLPDTLRSLGNAFLPLDKHTLSSFSTAWMTRLYVPFLLLLVATMLVFSIRRRVWRNVSRNELLLLSSTVILAAGLTLYLGPLEYRYAYPMFLPVSLIFVVVAAKLKGAWKMAWIAGHITVVALNFVVIQSIIAKRLY